MKVNPRHMDANGVRERIKDQHRKNMRESDTRRQFLQKYSRIISGVPDATLAFGELAYVTMEDGKPQITIPAREFNQPITGYTQNVYDLMVQETLTVHEILHILYTNYRSFKRYLNKCDDDNKPLFKEIWNALEDGAIEEQGRQSMSIADELEVMYSNMTDELVYGSEQSNGDIVYTMHEAVVAGLADLAIFDTGSFSKILDPNENHRMSTENDQQLIEDFEPKLRNCVTDILTTPSSKKRNARIYEFYLEYMDICDDAHIDGRQQRSSESQGGQGQGHPIPIMPDDTEGHTGTEKKDAYMLGTDQQKEDLDSRMPQASGSQNSQEDPNEEQQSSSAGQGDESNDDQKGDHGSDVETKQDLENEYQEELENEWDQHAMSNDGVQQEIDEAVEFLKAIDRGTSSSNSDWDPDEVEVEIPEPSDNYYNDRYTESSRRAKQLEDILRARLQSESRSKTVRNQRRGKFDQRGMVKAARGDTRAFYQEREKDEKDYDCVVVYDRSGSMNGGDKDLEVSGGMMGMALESIGVETSVLGLYRNEVRLELPFGAPVETKKSNLFAGDINGSTPLSKAIFLARHRLMNRNTNPFMVVVTDGMPDNPQRYKEELMKCNFPIIGIYLNTTVNAEDMTDYFHHVKNVEGDNITLELKRIVQRIMF